MNSLSDEEIDAIAEAIERGYTHSEISAKLNISEVTIDNFAKRYRWFKKNWRFTGRVNK